MMKIITFEPIEDPQDFALYEEPQDVSSYQGDSAIHIDQDEGSPKRPNDDAGDSVFGRFLKKFKKTDPVKASYQSNGAKNFKGEHGQKKQ